MRTTPTSRRQQMHSCDVCRRRKVRCDSVDEAPCSACTKAAVECRFTVGWRRQRRPQTRPGSRPQRFSQRFSSSSSSSSPSSPLPPSPRASLDETAATSTTVNTTAATTAATASPAHTSVSCSCPHNHRSDSTDTHTSHTSLAVEPPESEVALSINIAENGLLRFFRDGLSSSSWGVFDMPDNVRVTYMGTHISNMTHLIKLDRPRPQYLVYPYPQIRPPLSPLSCQQAQRHMRTDELRTKAATKSHDAAARDDNASSSAPSASAPSASFNAYPDVVVRDINSFPEKEIRDDFIDAYFEKVNPYFPVIDESDFRARYADPHNQPALVLLHSVLLVGAHVSSHAKAVHARHIVKAVLFRRAKCVFDMRHEHDRLHLVQAALLFTWHLQNGDTASSNSFYWLGVACRIAYGIGMHRDLMKDPLEPGRMPIQDRRLWRRIWWTLFQAEVLSALEHGRPSAIRREDFDQDPLCLEDFREVSGRINPNVQVAFCVRQTELCQIALDVMHLSAPGVARVLRGDDLRRRADELNARLVRWMLTLSSSGLGKTDSFGDIYLRLNYHTLVIHLYRLSLAELADFSTDAASSDNARRVGSSASGDIVSCFETLHEKNMLAQCPCNAVTALTAAAIQIGKDVQCSLGVLGEANGGPDSTASSTTTNTMLAVNGLCLLDRVCVAAEHLSVFWPNVEGVRKVFRSLYERFTTALDGIQMQQEQQQALQGRQGHMDSDDQMGRGTSVGPSAAAVSILDDGFGGVDWTDILGLTWQVGHGHNLQDACQTWDASLFGLD
ncbi:hypothetical protein HMPREF1624_08735 [Sporothrix schenckii ATCC 58251]|uniref:Zn(2)-C6 fungal-type domain-containing protein n=1 Tax=Sporothrix schenckii (strain ATCC 58251 / de Perez 2211183) TaxID=1391915 RepID=U7PGY7_SPOS1|nr:hypothetical protein HMPREF1624_08735 [Sporothrix schenckii ATCC 58251]